MTKYVLRKDADDFTRSLIAQGHDIEIVDKMPGRFEKPQKFVCQICKKMTPHRWTGTGWVCESH